MENCGDLKEKKFWKNGEFISLVGIILAGFYFMSTNIGHRIDRVEDRLVCVESRLNEIEKRLTVVETVIQMMGYPVKPKEKTGI